VAQSHSQQLADGRLVIDHKDLAAAYPQKVSPLAGHVLPLSRQLDF
jgi:hypothetical protein